MADNQRRPGDALREAGIKPVNPFEFIGRRCRYVRITPEMAEELARQTGCTAQFWLDMQEAYELPRPEKE